MAAGALVLAGGDPVDGQALVGGSSDPEFLAQFTGGGVSGGLALVHGTTRQETRVEIVDVLDQDLPKPVGDQHGRPDPQGGRGAQSAVRLVGHGGAGQLAGNGCGRHDSPGQKGLVEPGDE